jgi:hypothetical protein
MKILSSDKENLYVSKQLSFEKTSSNLITTKTIYFVLSNDEYVNLQSMNFKLSSEFDNFKFFETNEDTLFTSFLCNNFSAFSDKTTSQIDGSTGSFYVYAKQQKDVWVLTTKILFTSDFASSFYGQLSVKLSFSGDFEQFDKTYDLFAEVVELDAKLVVALQNFRQTFSDDYITAFYESDYKSNSIDYEMYNRKLREFLLNVQELIGFHGSYKNLLTALKFFGYADLLDLKEYWSNGNIYKSTSIQNFVLNYVDKTLSGFTKTNDMSLVYQIDETTGFDEDGLPIYRIVFESTDAILVKLEALKRILEKDFLHFNTFIVDIIGEMQTVIGLELNVMLDSSSVFNINLTDNLYVPVKFQLNEDLLLIKNNKVKVENYTYALENDKLIDRSNMLNYDSLEAFEVLSIFKQPEDFKDGDYLTAYYIGVFGIISLDIELDKTRYQHFTYRIYDDAGLVFESSIRKLSDFTGTIFTAIRKPGLYKIDVALVDWYGGNTIVGFNKVIEIQSDIVVTKLLSYSKHSNKQVFTSNSSIKSSSGSIRPQMKISYDSYDIMTYDDMMNTQQFDVKRHHTSDVDKYSTFCRINELNGTSINDLKGLSLDSFGSTIAVCLIDLIGNDTIDGLRKLMIYDYLSNDQIVISLMYDQLTMTSVDFYNSFIQQLHDLTKQDNILDDFCFDIQKVAIENADQTNIIKTKYFLRLRSKASSYKARLLNVNLQGAVDSAFLDQYAKTDVYINSFLGSFANIPLNLTTFNQAGELTFKVRNRKYKRENCTFSTIDELVDSINDIIHHNNLQFDVYQHPTDNVITITGTEAFEIEHISFGKFSDVVRGKQFKKAFELPFGSDLSLGETIILQLDDDNLSDMTDMKWELYDATTNDLLTTQKASRLIYLLKRRTTYSAKLSYTINGQVFEKLQTGICLVK